LMNVMKNRKIRMVAVCIAGIVLVIGVVYARAMYGIPHGWSGIKPGMKLKDVDKIVPLDKATIRNSLKCGVGWYDGSYSMWVPVSTNGCDPEAVVMSAIIKWNGLTLRRGIDTSSVVNHK